MRIKEFKSFLASKGIDACILVDSDPNIFYFSGIELDHCILAIPCNGDPFFIVSELESERIMKYSRIKKVVSCKSYLERNALLSRNLKAKLIGINKARISVRDFESFASVFPSAKFIDVNAGLTELRQVKTADEIERIKKACSVSDNAFSKLIDSFDFKKEQEVRDFLEDHIRKAGCKIAFQTIVASGTNSSIPHYSVFKGVLKGFCVIDFGARYEGYCSDITRTLFVGNPGKKEKMLYGIVRSAQEAAINSAKEGIDACKIDSVARGLIGKYSKNFIHGLGHQLGIEVHDLGFRISSYSSEKLRSNMVMTVEPGIYFKGKFGIRIEDDILIKKNSSEILSKSPKEFMVVNR